MYHLFDLIDIQPDKIHIWKFKLPKVTSQAAQADNQAAQVSNQVEQVSNQVAQVSDQAPQGKIRLFWSLKFLTGARASAGFYFESDWDYDSNLTHEELLSNRMILTFILNLDFRFDMRKIKGLVKSEVRLDFCTSGALLNVLLFIYYYTILYTIHRCVCCNKKKEK